MCREGGRRCDAKWDVAHRERYNARRRVARNSAKAQAAREAGNESQAAMYEALVASAREVEERVSQEITQHISDDHGGQAGAARCPDCGQFAGTAHDCPKTLTGSVARDSNGNLLVLHHGSATDFETFDPEFTGTGNDSWGSGFYFTDDEQRAHGYGEHVKSVLLNITNPIRVDGKEHASLDGQMFFSAAQSEAILKRHPDIYNQPGDEDNPNPLENFVAEFWDKDEWTRPEIDRMIGTVARDYFNDVAWSSVESVFEGGKSDAFRRGVRDVTGHDGVVTDFGAEGTHWVAWFPEQIQPAGKAPAAAARCARCGQYAGANHNCPGPKEQALTDWRRSLTADEREAFSDYGSVLHSDLNEKLRAAAGGSLESLDDSERRMVAGLDSALARAPRAESPYTVHRGIRTETTTGTGIDGREWVAQNAPVGETITFDGYTSTSLDPEQAEYFSDARGDFGASGVMFEIETTQGANWGADGPEAEVTLPRGSRFQVVSVDRTHTVNDLPYPKVHLREVLDTPRPAHPLAVASDEPFEFTYARNTESSKTHVTGNDFGQDIEPSGRYLSETTSGYTPQPGWETGTIRFERPLRMAWGTGGYSDDDNWKRRLSAHYDGKTGKALSQAVRNDGYDAIVTQDKYGTSEIIDLTGFSPVGD